ncbi:DUF421 domain-containing protein [Rhodobacteraceae bacterium 2CG4]|uniref:DUF421 domain-containing protein n=1 Tax=Halovulum marinum TaxID=2662447 RepID=A0A6L5Z505_9RHOB|nr:DUF421 domain-containing protein [Halovulum marinum]MSU91651.1 DUF421 domain-containing protein [Halovulum marinum]
MADVDIWFNSWARLQSIAVGSVFFFVFIVALMRLSGKRTTGQMNNFDWIITVAIGSLASSGILLKNVSIADAALAMVLLAALQSATTWLALRSPRFAGLVKPHPRILAEDGRYLREALRAERVTEAEVRAKLRAHGMTRLSEANFFGCRP